MKRRIRGNALLTPTDVAHLLSVHINTVRRWSNSGLLNSYRIGPRGDRRFRREDIAQFPVNQAERAYDRYNSNDH